jgi:hypothetical protein
MIAALHNRLGDWVRCSPENLIYKSIAPNPGSSRAYGAVLLIGKIGLVRIESLRHAALWKSRTS